MQEILEIFLIGNGAKWNDTFSKLALVETSKRHVTTQFFANLVENKTVMSILGCFKSFVRFDVGCFCSLQKELIYGCQKGTQYIEIDYDSRFLFKGNGQLFYDQAECRLCTG